MGLHMPLIDTGPTPSILHHVHLLSGRRLPSENTPSVTHAQYATPFHAFVAVLPRKSPTRMQKARGEARTPFPH